MSHIDASWTAKGFTLIEPLDPIPKVMGVLNRTPDSFSDGGKRMDLAVAVASALEMQAEGADVIDLGGESTRPGSRPVALDEELARVVPVLEALVGKLTAAISIDTSKAVVARRAIELGAVIVNDVTALGGDPEMAQVVSETGAGVVLMHMRGTPATMQDDLHYHDVVSEVYDFLAERIDWAISQGIPRDRIAIDPGVGFAKSHEQSVAILRNTARFAGLGCVVLIGLSRKGVVGSLTGRRVGERQTGSVVASLAAAARGARVLRVHDVGPMRDAVRVWSELIGWEIHE